jgi:hypothetical protein
MARKQHGDFGDTGLEDAPPHKYPPLAKSGDDLTAEDLERMCDAIEILERRAPTLSKTQLFKIQYQVGLAHHRLQKAIFAHITRPRGGGNVNSGTLEKVHRGNGSMDDSGLDSSETLIIPNVGTADKFSKVKKMDAFGEEIEHK